MTVILSQDQSELAQALFEESGDALFLLDPDTDQLLDVNPVAVRLTGYSRPELLQFQAGTLFRFEATGGLTRLRRAFTKTMAFHGQDGFLLKAKDGSWVPVSLTVSRLHLASKTLGLVIARDDRDRRQALATARRVEAELRTVLGSSPAALWSAERAPGPEVIQGWQFRYVSPMLSRLAGRPADFFDQPFKWSEAVHPADREEYRAWLRRLLAGTETEAETQYRVLAADGTVRWVRDRLQVVRDTCDRPVRLDGCLVDFTAERQAEDALRQNEQRFRALVEKSRDGIALIDERGVIRYASSALRPVTGRETTDSIGKDAFAFIHPDDLPAAREIFGYTLAHAGEDVSHTFRTVTPDGSLRVIEANVCNRLADPSVRAVVVNYRDTTDRIRLEEELRRAAKLEAVGRLAGGIAHDFNNLLTVVLGNLELLQSGAAGDSTAELLAATERAARQAADLTRQVLGFARQEPPRTAPVDLNILVTESLALLRRTIDPRIAIEFRGANDLRTVAADPVQVRQVLMNLCLNARDAMPDGGMLTIETANVNAARRPDAAADESPTDCVRVRVIDTGVGMTDEVRAKIFEPFFTTKGPGRGTGLGLAVVYGVARAHGGWVECASAPGSGSRFDVYLPQAKADEPMEQPGEKPAPLPGRGELVLVADDEPLVRSLARMSLEKHGYRVLLATDGAEAVEAFRRAAGTVAAVVLDASMPQMSGQQACDALRQLDPRTRVLFASGHALDVPTDATTAFLPKPYTPSELASAVRRLLDAPAE